MKVEGAMQRRRLTRSTLRDYLFLLPAILFFAALIYYPAISAVYLSFFRYRINGSTFIGLKNYIDLFADRHFTQEAVITTLQLGVWNVVLSFVIPIIIALVLFEVRQTGLQKSYQIIFYLPSLFS